MKLAYFSPFNPQPSGISDYSEELLPYLATHAEVDLFIDGFRPSNQEVLMRFGCFDYRANPESLERLPEYDAIIYHLGNDHRYHTGIMRVMRKYPGVVVFHDFALQDFFWGLSEERGDMRWYLDELEACHGTHERERAEEYSGRGAVPPQLNAPLRFPMNLRLAQAAEGIVVHSHWAREEFARIVPNVPVAQIPMAVLPNPASQLSAERNGTRLNIASFGLITPGKGIGKTVRALSALRDEFDFHYTLVGADNSYFDVQALIRSYRMGDRVTITGHLPLEEFERWILKTDIAVNLRERTVGETSASLFRIMAAGVPAIVSNVGAFSELPANAVIKIDQDEFCDALLEAYLREIIQNPRLRRQIGENARGHVRANHRIEKSAEQYLNFIREIIERRPRKQLVTKVANELSQLGFRANDEALLRGVAAEVALLAPARRKPDPGVPGQAAQLGWDGEGGPIPGKDVGGSAGCGSDSRSPSEEFDSLGCNTPGNGNRRVATESSDTKPAGRLAKIEGLDYKRAAVEYPSLLDAERSYYLRTKPFYNLANKPDKHTGDGLDPETHRHFTDFANMAAALALPPGASILDVGCGSGWLSEYFARLGYNVTGIDISDDLIQMARERVERVPYNVDHETPLNCRFLAHDIETAPLAEQFDAIICYDSLHHFVDEHAVMRHLSAMVALGGLLFILEGDKPEEGSATEEELVGVMREFGTLESPFSDEYLRSVIDVNGFAVVGNYVSISGLFEREMLEGKLVERHLPLRTLPTNYHYLTCMKVVAEGSAACVPDSRHPGVLKAKLTVRGQIAPTVEPGAALELPISLTNSGDTLWLTGQTVRAGVVMPGVRVTDTRAEIVSEFHGQPMLSRAVAPGQTISVTLKFLAPDEPGHYTVKIDLVDQHICWFEERGSEPLMLNLEVRDK